MLVIVLKLTVNLDVDLIVERIRSVLLVCTLLLAFLFHHSVLPCSGPARFSDGQRINN